MKGADTLISVRFLTLLGHFSILVTLLWENNENLHHCLPIQSQYPMANVQTHQHWSVAGLATSLALVVVEFTTFIFGLTMFESFVNLTSITGHGIASIILKFYVPDTLLCDWFWPVYFFFSVLPFVFDITTSAINVANEQQHLTQTHEFKPGWSFYLVLAGVTTTFGSSLPVGFNIGVVNSPAEIIKTFCNESFISRYDLPLDKTWLNVLWSSIVSIFIVGGCTGSILGSFFADKFGRKYATIITNLLSIAGAILFLFCREANSVEMLILGRLLVGLAGGLTTSIVPMYLTELSPPRLSGAMGVACPIGVNAGVLVGQVMGLDIILGGVDNWPYLLSVFALLVIISLPILFILPESPKYLFVVKRNEPAAIKELSRLRGEIPSVLTEDLELLREEVQAEASTSGEKWGMWRVACDPKLRLPLLLACTMQAGQQTSGINAVFYYSQTIFEQAGLSARQAQLATIGCGAVNVCTALAMLPLLPRAGRRALLLASAAAAAPLLAALALAMACIDAMPWMPYVCMAAVILYVLVFGFGLGPIPYFIASELFEVSTRAGGMAWGSLCNWGGNFLVGMSFPTLRDFVGAGSFLLFSALTAALFFFQRLYFPETKGKTPTQVAQLCSRGLKSRPLNSRHQGDA